MNKSITIIVTLLVLSLVCSPDPTQECGATGVFCKDGNTCCQCKPGQNPTFTCRDRPKNFYCWDNRVINYDYAGRVNDPRPLVCPGDGLTPCPTGWIIDRTTSKGCKKGTNSAFLEMLNEVEDS